MSLPLHPSHKIIDEKNHDLDPIAHSETSPIEHISSSTGSRSSSDDSSIHGHGSLERISTVQDDRLPVSAVRTTTTASTIVPVHSVFTKNQKRFIVAMASWAGFFSPVSGNIYFPALNSLARDLHVSSGTINLTLTSYMIFQGLAPAFIGDLADVAGRRPAYATCFIIYIAANIGLALQNSFPALLVLRCLQSSGSSGTIALSSGVVSDVATAAERGSYMGLTTAGALLGPAIGPVIGGILAEFLGWRAIFWFLTILGSLYLVVFAVFFPETARTAVGNGSIPPKGWNMSLMNYLAVRKAHQEQNLTLTQTQTTLPKRPFRFPNPLSSVHILADKENAALLFYNGFLFSVFYDITATLPSLFAIIYGFNALQIGLCFIPFGIGACAAALTNGQMLDWNFRRWARKTGLQIKKGRQQNLQDFPIEKARLEVGFPFVYAAAAFVLVWGWMLQIEAPLAVMLVLLFLIGYSMTAASNVMSTMMVDFYPRSPATATAANNLVRCLLGAGATAVIIPMVNSMGRGWCYTALALFLAVISPMLWVVYFWGKKWRAEREEKDVRVKAAKEARRAGSVEEEAVEGTGVEKGNEKETEKEYDDLGDSENGTRGRSGRNGFGGAFRTYSRESAF